MASAAEVRLAAIEVGWSKSAAEAEMTATKRTPHGPGPSPSQGTTTDPCPAVTTRKRLRRVVLRPRSTAFLPALMLVTGCAPGAAGLVSGEVLEADGARVIVVRGYGVQLRGAPIDAGLTLGYARRTYVYPDTTPELPDTGRYYFWVPQPTTAPIAWDGQAIGLDVRMAASSLGITLGFRGTAVLARVPAAETVYYRLRVEPDDPASTLLRLCRGENECASFDFTALGGG